MENKIFGGALTGNEIIVQKDIQECYDVGCYGSIEGKVNKLSLVEALHLVDRKRLEVKDGKKKLKRDDLYKKACEIDKEFPQKYVVYRDLRERGYVVRTGFKFGTHFRVYERGVKLKRGQKAAHEHTKFVVHCVP